MRKQSQMSRAIDELVDKVKRLEVQIEIARLQEREACAKLCEDLADLNDWADSYANKCAAVIRARKTE
jgi:hypothetical protein